MVTPEGAVYCTLLLSDNYLPGAVVLAHSLRDNGSRAKLVAFYTPDTLQASTINELQAVYNVLIPVYRMTNHTPANLWLMERPDLIATFTKIELWRQTQFERIVYIDSDVVAVRAPDELLELDVDFAAAPDVGWPDCFNSGVMVLRPNMQDYFALKALAERGISFDGADQGLLNMHFRDWHRLSFTYNCTPSANYQYIPAYKHFQSTISLVHFIGSQKPWNMSRQVTPFDSPFNQLLGRWWAIYDRHYYPTAIEQIRPDTRATIPHVVYTDESVSEIHVQTSHETVQQQYSEQASVFTISVPQTDLSSSPQLEYHTREQTSNEAAQLSYPPESSDVTFPAQEPSERHHEQPAHQPVISVVPQYVWGEEHVKTYIQQHHQDHTHRFTQSTPEQGPSVSSEPAHPLGHGESHHPQPQASIETQRTPSPRPPPQEPQEQPTFEAPQAEWDASREPPPLYSKPEGIALETKTYTMSDDNQLFQPPASYPEAPKNMYYQVPTVKPEPERLTQIFPWEKNAPKPTRVFADEQPQIQRLPSPISAKEDSRTSQSSHPTSWTSEVPSLPSESWDTYSRSNAWDEVPEIQQYIQSIQGPRKGSVQVLSGGPSQQNTSTPTPTRQPGPNIGTRITDFPSETERPSLPVTPAPIHRAPATGSPDEFTTKQLPAAEGVPSQEDWNPSVRLERLRRRQNGGLDSSDSLVDRLTRVLEYGDGGSMGDEESHSHSREFGPDPD